MCRAAAMAAMAATILCGTARAEDGLTFNPHLTLQFDSVAVADARLPPGADLATGGSFRRIRLGVDGELAQDWSYGLTARLENASLHYLQVANAFVQYDGLGPLHFKLGIFSPPENFEASTSSAEVLFLERAQPSELARSVGAGLGRTAAMVFAHDESYFAALALAGGIANDSPLRQKSVIGRFAWRPWHEGDSSIAVGANLTHLFAPPRTGATHDVRLQSRAEISVKSVDTRLLDTGPLDVDSVTEFGLEAGGNSGSLYAQGGLFHYAIGRAAPALSDPVFRGWYLQGSWFITGEVRQWRSERAGFAAPAPASPVDKGGFGAFEIAARYSELDLDHAAGLAATPIAADAVRGGHQRIATLGLNWYPGEPFRFLLDYQHVAVSRLSGTGSDLGAAADMISLRSQLSF